MHAIRRGFRRMVHLGRIDMKVLKYRNDKSWFESHVHLTITRQRPDDKSSSDLIAVGLIDVDSAARAMVARLSKGEKVDLHAGTRGRFENTLFPEKHGYRFVSRPIGKLTHCIVLHKSAVDEQLDNGSRILIVPSGGDPADLLLSRIASDFNLPHVVEWKYVLWDECQRRGFVKQLDIWTDPEVRHWKDVQGFELTSAFTEEKAKELVSQLLANEYISLPEGITDAPALLEVLEPDEDGNYSVMDYLQNFAPHLATTIEDMAQPLHDLDRPIDPAIATMARVPFPAQAHTTQALVNGLKENKGVIAASDMGTGKTLVSLGVANTLASKSKHGFANLALVPGITIPKWIDEIRKTIPGAKISVIENWHDIVKYRDKFVRHGSRKAHLEFVLLSRDTAKLGMPKVPALVYKKRTMLADRKGITPPKKPLFRSDATGTTIGLGEPDRCNGVYVVENAWTCPSCGAIQQKTDRTSKKEAKNNSTEIERIRELKLGFHDLASGWTDKGRPIFKSNVTEYHCSECEENLMRYAVPERESVSGLKHRRLQPSWFISRYMRGHWDLTIVDELHQFKSNSGQGESFGAIAGASKRVLGLTGTLSTGMASSLYHLLWRISPGKMIADSMDHKSLSKFVHLYGSYETKTRYSKDDIVAAGGSTNRKVIRNPPREIPGLSPRLFVQHLADKAVFLELGDLGLPLVELEEKPVFVEMDGDHKHVYLDFHSNLEAAMKTEYAKGNTGAFARFIPSTVNAACQPHKSLLVEFEDDLVSFHAPNAESDLSSKERQLIKDIKVELAEGRKCVVYVRYSGTAGQDTRIANILKGEGIRVKVLSSSVSPEDRVDWLEEAVKKNIDVVVTNAKLVEVGLDLLSYPTLMFWQFTDEVSVMRQSSKRSWRIGQNRRCRIIYYIHSESYEVVQFRRMMKKRSHAMLLEGRILSDDMEAFADKDEKSSSTFNIASCLVDVSDLTQKWQALADLDVPEGVTMLSEEQFKTEIGLAMKRLASETRRLAGVPDPSNDEVDVVPINEVSMPRSAPRVQQSAQVFPLFGLCEPGDDMEVESETGSDYRTVGELRKSMGIVTKAKRKDKIGDDQVALFAF